VQIGLRSVGSGSAPNRRGQLWRLKVNISPGEDDMATVTVYTNIG
jgi:hypothetical protein